MRKEEPVKSHDVLAKMREDEKRLLQAFPEAPYHAGPAKPGQRSSGVLLSDEIEFYCQHYKLVDPYEPNNLMASSYELRVGDRYAIGKNIRPLSRGEVLEIPKFEVVVVEILERINMPHFLIGRWNIRTRWAYEGLIWVGGPQVNAGYRGRLMCPLWNLSNRAISIPWGEAVAVMDFVATTPPTEKSNRRPLWNERSRYIFEDYLTSDLRSGLVTDAVDKIAALQLDTAEQFRQNRQRMDNFNSIMFTALGVLVAAIAMFATKATDAPQYWWDPTVFWLCWVTAALTLFAWLRFSSKGPWGKLLRAVVCFIAVGCMALLLYHDWHRVKSDQQSIQKLSERVNSLENTNRVLEEQLSRLSSLHGSAKH